MFTAHLFLLDFPTPLPFQAAGLQMLHFPVELQQLLLAV